ncbi:hypothetical protein [Tatumella sp. OPLPL6]|uniref:hypothetical protein n=1 Tax=Tatumella sp. OPLPL6 TaxID=1928657 RepID=UPI000C1836A8|nr:hypothetical protein [Tatumella sp. OPLPL6]PIJ47016.1 hypothetical protein BOM24_00395 [Tatumella sp. OPLPL6]
MNQRLIIIISIVLFLLGIVGVYFSDNESEPSDPQQHSSPSVTYFVSKRVMAAGEEITKNDYEEKTEDLTDDTPPPDTLAAVEGLYLTESVAKGTTFTQQLVTKEKPINRQSSELFRYTIELNRQYVNNLYGLLPGADVDIYVRFESPRREHNNKSTIYRGESVVKIVKLFKNKKLLTPVMRGDHAISEEDKQIIASSDFGKKSSGEYKVDVELSRSDLKKIYQIENKYEMIVFPAETITTGKSGVTIKNKEGK